MRVCVEFSRSKFQKIIENSKGIEEATSAIKVFLEKVKPKHLLIGGPCERTQLGFAELVQNVFCKALTP